MRIPEGLNPSSLWGCFAAQVVESAERPAPPPAPQEVQKGLGFRVQGLGFGIGV